jgi:acyl-CoA synthetase (AMP-forming)/AMP-acid ligase II
MIETLAEIPGLHGRDHADAIALQCDGRTVTYGDLERRSDAAADMLAALGVAPGGRVAWLGSSHEAFFEILFGAAKARACLVPINSRLAIPELAFVLDDSSASVLFVTADHLATAKAVLVEIARWIELIVVGDARSPFADYEALREAAPPAPARAPLPSDDVVQMYTSGTTGLPKGVRLTNANLAAFVNTGMTFRGLDFAPRDVFLGVMPLFHVGGVNPALTCLAGGARMILIPTFEPGAVLRMVEAERASVMGFVPAMLGMLLRSPEAARCDLSSVEKLIYGGSPISEAVLGAAFARLNCDIVQMYGMTESSAAGTILTPEDHRAGRLRSCGRPWPDHEVRIADAAGATAPVGEIGEIQIRGPGVMAGYWNRPRETAETITPDGWLKTGDAAYRDADGYFHVHDRVKDMIVSGGENVYPAEVENAIMGCPGVAEAAVIGVPDPRWGEAVKAIVTLAPGAETDEGAVIDWVRARIAGYKTPKSVEFVEALPRNATNKVLRRVLREPYWEGRGRLVG